jgi:hypothetical protein
MQNDGTETYQGICMDSKQWLRTISANCFAFVPGAAYQPELLTLFHDSIKYFLRLLFKFDQELHPAHVTTDVFFKPVMPNQWHACRRK